MVHGVVKKSGGEIKITSNIGQGTTFHVYLPAIAAEADTHPLGDTDALVGGIEHIFTVDDEEALVEVEQSMLKRMGYRISTRTSSIEALKAFKHSPDRYDLVITDMTMPQMTDLALTKELKQIRKDIKIILCTGFSEQVNKETVDQYDIDGFIMKPIIMSELSATVKDVLKG